MDWGLFDGTYFLREQLIYSKKVRWLCLPALSWCVRLSLDLLHNGDP